MKRVQRQLVASNCYRHLFNLVNNRRGMPESDRVMFLYLARDERYPAAPDRVS